MRCTLLCDGRPVGHVELSFGPRTVTGPLEPLPAYDDIRPILERASGAHRALARRTADWMQQSRPRAAADGDPPTGMTAFSMPPELAPDVEDARATMAPAQALRFSLEDDAGHTLPRRVVMVMPAISASDDRSSVVVISTEPRRE